MPPRPAFPSTSFAPVGPGPRRGRRRALVVRLMALLLQAAAAPLRPAAAAALPAPALVPPPLSQAEFQELLRHGTLEQLAEGCQRVVEADRLDRLRRIRERLLLILPAPQPLPVVLANAEVLLSCHQPQAALTVLDRISPAAGAERLQWLLMQWRAAQAAMDHRRAALALERLVAARPARLEALLLPVLRREDGTVVSRPALDVLADHLQARGFPQAAATLLLASQEAGVIGAERRLEAVRLLQALPAEERAALLESALDQAAAVGARLATTAIDAVYCSTMQRARDTAAAIAGHHGLDPRQEHEIREVDPWESFPRDKRLLDVYTKAELVEIFSRAHRERRYDAYPHCEDPASFRRRVTTTIDGIAAAHPGERVVVACHGGVIGAYLAHCFEARVDTVMAIHHTSITTVRVSGDRRVVLSANDYHHLVGVQTERNPLNAH